VPRTRSPFQGGAMLGEGDGEGQGMPWNGSLFREKLFRCHKYPGSGLRSRFRQTLCSVQRADRVANFVPPIVAHNLLKAARGFAKRRLVLSGENSLSGINVMVIDDSNTIRRSAEIFLLQSGCTVILAEDGFDSLAKIADHQPNIIFVDIMMPRLDGYQTCALIKNNQIFKSTPVIMLSSKDGLFDKARGRIVGSEQYLTKPFTREELLGAIRRHVGNR